MKGISRLKFFKIPVLLLMTASILITTGCMGQMALSQKVKKGNLSIVENRWGREGVFLGLTVLWVYRITAVADLLVFNSIEFWSETNPLNDKPALVDLPMDMLDKVFGERSIDVAQIQRIDENQAKMLLTFANGDKMTFDVVRTDDLYTVSYLGREFYTGQINNAPGLVTEGG